MLLALVMAAACAHADPAPPATATTTSRAPAPSAVDLNRATAPDLIALPGIGPSKAEAILAYRSKHGGFRRIEDLRRVKGFGRKTIARLRPLLTVTQPPPR
jgi:competence protein ComEA